AAALKSPEAGSHAITATLKPKYCGQSWFNSSGCTHPATASVNVMFTAPKFKVTASGDSHETISPTGEQTVAAGATQALVVPANTGYELSTTVGGTCPAGTWSGSMYTTGTITADCSVSFSATAVDNCVTNNGGCGANATCSSTGPGTSTCACATN